MNTLAVVQKGGDPFNHTPSPSAQTASPKYRDHGKLSITSSFNQSKKASLLTDTIFGRQILGCRDIENAQEMTGNLVYLQVLTKQIDDGLVIYSLKKSIFLSFQVFHIGVFFHPERDLKIMKSVNWKVFQGYWFERKLEHGKRQSQPLLINKCWWYQNFYH